MSEDGAAERFWLQLQTLYMAAGKPTLKQLVRLGLAQDPPIEIGHSTINGWLNSQAVPIGRKNERYLTAMVASLQARVRSDARYQRLPPGEWGRLLRAAQAQRAAGKQKGRPHRPDISPRGGYAVEPSIRPASTHARIRVVPVAARGPLVGRDSELALLAGLVEGIVAGRGSVLLIEGEPGIGKSSLVQETLADSDGRGCRVFWGTCSELDQALPLQPLLDALNVRESSVDPRRKMITRFLRGEISTDRGTDGPALFAEQLLALVTEECAVQPTVVVVDDLQWADQASIGLLARLASSVQQLPLLLVGIMRPVPQRDSLFALRRIAEGATRVQLAGLTKDATAELVASLVCGTPDCQLLRLADDAMGNPLYITELVAALTRSSMVTVRGGVAELVPGPTPRSLSAVIADRLDFISGPDREVLRSASLLGPQFAVTDLASLLGHGVADLATSLHKACAAGVLTESGSQLRFRHPLIHAALYGEMPGPVRAAWHREAGRILASAGAPADRVARQLLSAIGEPNDPAEPIDEWMLSWLADEAGALVAQAPHVAAALLRRAVADVPTNSDRHGRLTSQLANALYSIGECAAAAEVAVRELEHAVDPDVLVGLDQTLAQYRMRAGMTVESLETLEHALGTPGLSAHHRGRLLVLAARTYNYCGELEKARDVASTALAAAEAAHDTWGMGWALHTMAIEAVVQGRLAEQVPLFDRGLAVCEADPALADLRLLLQINKAATLGNFGRFEEALLIAGQARRLADQLGILVRSAEAHSVLGQLLFETGRWDDALAEIAVLPESTKAPIAVCAELGMAAQISFHRGDISAARGHLSAAAPQVARTGRLLIAPLTLAHSLDQEYAGALPAALSKLTRWLEDCSGDITQIQDLVPDAVRLAMRIGDLDVARTVTKQSVDLANGEETPTLQANALYCRGVLAHDARLLGDAAEQYRQAGRPLLRAKALEAAAAACARVGDGVLARSALADAREVYTWLGASADAARTKTGLEMVGTPA